MSHTKKITVTNFEVGNINSIDNSDLENPNLSRSIEYIPTNGSRFAHVKWMLGFDKIVCYDENKNIISPDLCFYKLFILGYFLVFLILPVLGVIS